MILFRHRLWTMVLLCAMVFSGPTAALATEDVLATTKDTVTPEASTSVEETIDASGEETAPVEPLPPSTPDTPTPQPEEPPAASPLPPALIAEHVKYMVGFTDGTMQPSKILSRAEAVSLIHRLLADPESGTGMVPFTDIKDSDWFAEPVRALARLGMLENEPRFRPQDAITRAEFVTILVHLAPNAQGNAQFPDVPQDHWAAPSIAKAVALGWVSGFPDGTFGPERSLSRAEACAILNRITGRSGDVARAKVLLGLGLYKDVSASHWAGTTICEATVPHAASGAMASESWDGLDYDSLSFIPGTHNISGVLYAVNRYGRLIRNSVVGAYIADMEGRLTATQQHYQSSVPYISMLDGLGATVGCEPISSLMGLRAKGFATEVDPRTFLARLPYADSNPEYGFVGSPYHSDGRYSSINPRPLTAYCNTYCSGAVACADFSGASIAAVRQELLCGNLIAAYQTYWWEPIRHGKFLIGGRWQSMVANNHVRLIAGYDPTLGYFVSDPYNPNMPGQVYQYWIDAQTFETLWNQRKMGMVIR